MEQIKENIRTMLDQIAAQDPAAAQSFQDIVQAKVEGALENMKTEVGQQFFNQSSDMNEETEQIDEISGATLGSYIQKARKQDNDKRVHGNELDQLPKVKAEKEKISGWYADKRYKSNGESVHRAKINKAYDRINDIKKKADPSYPESVIPKRHKGVGLAIQKLQYGKMTEDQEQLQEYHAAGTVNGKPWSVAYSDYPEHSAIAASNKHLSKSEVGAISSHIDQYSDDDFSGTKSTQNGHVVHVTHNGGSHGD